MIGTLNKETITRMKGLFSALLVLSLVAIVILPMTSDILNERESVIQINIHITLLIVWILLVLTLAIIYLAGKAGGGLKPYFLPIKGR